jgi:hypothetical protein
LECGIMPAARYENVTVRDHEGVSDKPGIPV